MEGAVVGFKLLTSGVLDRPTAPATSEFRKNVTLDSHWNTRSGESRTDPTSASFFSTHFWTFHN